MKKELKRQFEGRGSVSLISLFSTDKISETGYDIYLLCAMIADHVTLLAIFTRAGRRRVKDSRPFFFFVVSRWYGGLAKLACGFINKMAETILSEILVEGWFKNEKQFQF